MTRAIPVVAPAPQVRDPWWRRGVPVAIGATSAFVVLLLVLAMLGPGKPVEGAPADVSSSSPTPAWMLQLMSAYTDACGEALDPAKIAGLAQPDAEERVTTLIDECGATQSAGGGNSGGKGKGHGKP